MTFYLTFVFNFLILHFDTTLFFKIGLSPFAKKGLWNKFCGTGFNLSYNPTAKFLPKFDINNMLLQKFKKYIAEKLLHGIEVVNDLLAKGDTASAAPVATKASADASTSGDVDVQLAVAAGCIRAADPIPIEVPAATDA